MKSLQVNYHLAVTVILALISVIIILFAGRMIERSIESHSLWKLSQQASSGIDKLELELSLRSALVDSLELVAQDMGSKNFPTLLSFKQLLSKQKLKLMNVEQVNSNSDDGLAAQHYRVSITGKIGQHARFLKSLEDRYLTEIDQLQLFPADDRSEKIMMRFLLKVSE